MFGKEYNTLRQINCFLEIRDYYQLPVTFQKHNKTNHSLDARPIMANVIQPSLYVQKKDFLYWLVRQVFCTCWALFGLIVWAFDRLRWWLRPYSRTSSWTYNCNVLRRRTTSNRYPTRKGYNHLSDELPFYLYGNVSMEIWSMSCFGLRIDFCSVI